jgi:hypothetical protein
MYKKLSVAALVFTVAVVAFLAGTMYNSATAQPTPSTGKKWIGVVVEQYGANGVLSPYTYAIYDDNGVPKRVLVNNR